MAQRVFRLTCVAVALVVTVALYAPSVDATPLLSISPGSQTVNVGDNVSLNLDISGVFDLYTFQFDVAFDPTILQASAIVEGAFLPSGGPTLYIPGLIDNTLGTIAFTGDTLTGAVPGVSGSGTLATFDFSAAAAGSGPITISNVLLLDSVGNTLNFTTANGAVNVQPVPTPEPATLTLVGVGAGLTMITERYRKRRRRRQ
jgi:hypothetical protein